MFISEKKLCNNSKVWKMRLALTGDMGNSRIPQKTGKLMETPEWKALSGIISLNYI